MDMCSLFILEILQTTFFFFFASSKEILLILDFTNPLHSIPKPFLACFCGPALVSLRYDHWCSSSVAVESCSHHSLSIKSGNETTSRLCWEEVPASGFLSGLAPYVIPFLVYFFFLFLKFSLSVSFSIAHKYDPVKLKKIVP